MQQVEAKYGTPALIHVPLLVQGKSRDSFPARWPHKDFDQRPPRLIVATNRISTHNVVHQSLIPLKDQVLTALVVFWFTQVLSPAVPGIPHHLLACGKQIRPYLMGNPAAYPDDIHLGSIIVHSLDITMVEFIYRAYLTGSLWKDYSRGLDPYGLSLPPGLPLMHKFDPPIFTPTVKSDTDPPLEAAEVRKLHNGPSELTGKVFDIGREFLNKVGLELVDSKFEVGYDAEGYLRVGDEVLTGDSSRIVNLSDISEGQDPPWRDKQVARDEAERMWAGGNRVPLAFSDEVVKKLSSTYLELFEQITGMTLARFQRQYLS